MKISLKKIITIFAWVIFVYYMSIALYDVVRKTYLHSILDESGIEVKGYITEKNRIGGHNGRYEVGYRFENNGEVIKGKDYVSRFDRRQVGDTITLLFSRDNPNLNIVKE